MSFDFQEADQTSSNGTQETVGCWYASLPFYWELFVQMSLLIFGGDHPLGLPLIMELEAKGYIVITSVSSPEGVSAIERKSHGFIRDLILDPNEVRHCFVVSAVCLNTPLVWHHPNTPPVLASTCHDASLFQLLAIPLFPAHRIDRDLVRGVPIRSEQPTFWSYLTCLSKRMASPGG